MSTLCVVATVPKNSRQCLRIALEEFKGTSFVDVRVIQQFEGGDPVMTRKGISLQIVHLDRLISALQLAQREARRLGLIRDEPRVAA